MRILTLSLPDFKNFRNFTIDFSDNEADVLLVGRNGAGKSNLIEAITIIFRDLIERTSSQSLKTPFAYNIEYKISGKVVRIAHDPARVRRRTEVFVDGLESSVQNLRGQNELDLLPKTVFAYYSGPSDRLASLFDTSLAEFRSAMIAGDSGAAQRLVYGRLIHSRFVLLAFLSESDPETLNILDEELGILSLESARFVLQQPYWARAQGPRQKSKFWQAKGVVRDFLQALYDNALAPLQLDARERTGIKQVSRREHLHLFLESPQKLLKVIDELRPAEGEPPARTLFRVLESAFVSDLIADVAVKIRKRDADGEITFRELSEGEQQLLMVLGLLRFTRNEESLFLLDEPDTHLNPVWGLRFLELINKVVGKDKSRHLICATHDPVAVAVASRDQVRLLSRESNGEIVAHKPAEDPILLGVAGVLTSELFGLRSIMAPSIQRKIERKHTLMARGETRSPADTKEFARLDRELNDVELSASHPDPLYAEFVKRLLHREAKLFQGQDRLSSEDQKLRDELMDEVLDELFGS